VGLVTRHATLSENAGVARGWNVGWQLTTADVVCFLNEDVRLARGALAPLLEALDDDPGAGVAGARGMRWDRAAMRREAWVEPGPGERLPCDVVSGFAIAVRRALLREAGGFDERFSPAGGEEVDLCLAAQERGWGRIAVGCPGVQHDWGISSASRGRSVAWIGGEEQLYDVADRNRRLLLAKWSDRPARADGADAELAPRTALQRLAVRARYAGPALAFRARRRLARLRRR
jgi:GT2 family glycosyltransferase